jgi:hypothetical protein
MRDDMSVNVCLGIMGSIFVSWIITGAIFYAAGY